MEMPGRRSNYSLLNPHREEEDQQLHQQSKVAGGTSLFHESLSAEKNKGGKQLDWEGDFRFQPPLRISNMGLQTQSSGSSFGESSLSGEYYAASASAAASDQEVFGGYLQEDLLKAAAGGAGELMTSGSKLVGSSSSKTWAQQTEESYQLQLALALRLSADASCADDPNFLDAEPDESARWSSLASAEALSHRFWVNGCLSYFDRIPDGFYHINGVHPYVWAICTDLQQNGRVPSIEALRVMRGGDNSPVEVVLIDKRSDPLLNELRNRALIISKTCISPQEAVDQLAKLVCKHMGGAASTGEHALVSRWKDCIEVLKDCLDSVVLPIGSISVGLCRHRALLFKVLADIIDLPCRVVRGCKYCSTNESSSCLVHFGPDREYLVDLIEKPGYLIEPDSSLNGPTSIWISSPLRLPKFKVVETSENSRLLAKQYFMDCQSHKIEFADAPAGTTNSYVVVDQFEEHGQLPHLASSSSPQNMTNKRQLVMDSIPVMHVPPGGQQILPSVNVYNQKVDTSSDPRFIGGNQVAPNKSSTELSLDGEDLDIPWDDLILKEKIGAGSFGTVHRADWNGSEVAVKILMEQDFHAERFKEFLREVALMKRLRHPNIVLFMGAVTQPPNLSIVTEYLSRGSLYRLLHKSSAREMLDERRRISMAFDVAKGMNYLHRRNPPIVHRDLKSPNLLVDRKYTVKVCDFGLSRLKANTFLSAKSAAGTPEWMAPEVLRDEPSNEKCDIYSFGVILWELMTMQLPWSNLNQAQVVAAVGFRNQMLDIPSSVNPQVALLIQRCWANDSWKRPSFSTIMEYLKPLIKPPTVQSGHAALPRIT